MKFKPLHTWPNCYADAIAVQESLRSRVVIRPLPRNPKTVAGADVLYDKGSRLMHAGVVVMTFPGLDVIEQQALSIPVDFPYIPGLLSFREAPALLEVFRRLEHEPAVVIFDGQGTAHMRGIGLASHVGLWLGVPSVGCAKSRLVGRHRTPGLRRGGRTTLQYGGHAVGCVLRTRDDVKPVYVSPGHLADIASSARLVLRCTPPFRLPAPVRAAHALVNALRREHALSARE